MSASATTNAEAHWRALCYLGAGQLFCARRALQPEALELGDLKPRFVGHWGTLPGVAYGLALATAGGDCRVVVGTGHAAGVVRAELWLRGVLQEVPAGRAGADLLCRGFGAPGGSTTELDPGWPGIPWTGGELGPALAIAAGAAVRAPEPIVAITGDGEVETGAASAAALAIGELAKAGPVRLVWLINRNGWRMGGPSRLGGADPEAIRRWLEFSGWTTETLTGEVATDHRRMELALRSAREGIPCALILATEKGWTGPASLAGRPFRGSSQAHKLPLARADVDAAVLEELRAWLASYRPASLFDGEGAPTGALARALARPATLRPFPAPLPRSSRLAAAPPPADAGRCPIDGAIAAIASLPPPALVTSPDELASNRGAELRGVPGLHLAETLSEEVCAAWLWGYTRSGRRGAFLTYEAFAPLIASQVAQYGKILAAGRQADHPSFVVVQTSLGWHNTPSHANPDLAGIVASKPWPFARVWLPLDDDDAGRVTWQALSASGSLEVVVTSKHPLPRYLEGAAGDLLVRLQRPAPEDAVGDRALPLVAAGDLALREACAAAELASAARVRAEVLAVRELCALGSPELRPHAPSPAAFGALLGPRRGVVVTTLAPAAVAGLLAERRVADRFLILGYRDAASQTPLGTLLANGCDRWRVAAVLLEQAVGEGILREEEAAPFWTCWREARERIWRDSIEDGQDRPLDPISAWRVAS